MTREERIRALAYLIHHENNEDNPEWALRRAARCVDAIDALPVPGCKPSVDFSGYEKLCGFCHGTGTKNVRHEAGMTYGEWCDHCNGTGKADR